MPAAPNLAGIDFEVIPTLDLSTEQWQQIREVEFRALLSHLCSTPRDQIYSAIYGKAGEEYFTRLADDRMSDLNSQPHREIDITDYITEHTVPGQLVDNFASQVRHSNFVAALAISRMDKHRDEIIGVALSTDMARVDNPAHVHSLSFRSARSTHCWLQTLAVREPFEQRGIGSALIGLTAYNRHRLQPFLAMPWILKNSRTGSKVLRSLGVELTGAAFADQRFTANGQELLRYEHLGEVATVRAHARAYGIAHPRRLAARNKFFRATA